MDRGPLALDSGRKQIVARCYSFRDIEVAQTKGESGLADNHLSYIPNESVPTHNNERFTMLF